MGEVEPLKLVLVDDEAILLKGLAETYHWEEMGFTVAGVAKSGEEAVAVIRKKEPHAVLCDIRMEQMNGLMVMEEIQKTHPGIQFIFLSGYQDFEYVKKACELGAVSYLLKPVTDEELEKTMRQAFDIAVKQIQNEKQQENWKRLLSADETGFMQVAVHKYLRNQIPSEQMEQILKLLGGTAANDMFIAVCADIDITYKITHQLEYEGARMALARYLETVLKKEFAAWQLEGDEKQYIYLIKTREPFLNRRLKSLLEQCRQQLGSPMTASVSRPYKGLLGLKKSYQEAIKGFNHADAWGASTFTAAMAAKAGSADHYTGEEERMVIKAVRKNDEQELKQAFIRFIYALPKDKELQGRYLHRLMLQAEFAIRESYGLTDGLKIAFQNYFQNQYQLEASRMVDICHKILSQAVNERKRSINQKENAYFSEYMAKAVAYIEGNLSDEGLSIVAVANHIYLHPVYFGRIFKHTFKMTFKQYLIQQRIEEAKKLLQSGNDGIGVICGKVGIPNPSYFTQLFKQYTGMLPSEFKREFKA